MIPTAPSGAWNHPLLSASFTYPHLCLWRVPQVTLGWLLSWGSGTGGAQVQRLLEVGAALPFEKVNLSSWCSGQFLWEITVSFLAGT